MHALLSPTSHRPRDHALSGVLAILFWFTALVVVAVAVLQPAPANAAAQVTDGRPGAVSFGSASNPGMLNAANRSLGPDRGYATEFWSGRVWIDPVVPASGESVVGQVVTAELRLDRWDQTANVWVTVERKAPITVDLSSASGNTYGEIAPIRFNTVTPGGQAGAVLSWADYRVAATFTWDRKDGKGTLGSLTVTPDKLSDVSCGRWTRCTPVADGSGAYLSVA